MVQAERWAEKDSPQNGPAFKVKSPIRMDQYDSELAEEMGWANSTLSMDGDAANISQDNPGILWVGHEGASPAKVLETLSRHQPDDEWYHAKPIDPALSLRALAKKAASGGTLTPEEVQFSVRGLLMAHAGIRDSA